jgi:hypothetical protein
LCLAMRAIPNPGGVDAIGGRGGGSVAEILELQRDIGD